MPVILGGYSLGGLFALWSSMQTDRFAAIAAASPSLWIRDWLDFAKDHPVKAGKVYLSLGDQEEHVKNRAIKRVGDCVRAEYELLKAQLGTENCTLEWNQGGHFQDGDKRLASAFIWCITTLASSIRRCFGLSAGQCFAKSGEFSIFVPIKSNSNGAIHN